MNGRENRFGTIAKTMYYINIILNDLIIAIIAESHANESAQMVSQTSKTKDSIIILSHIESRLTSPIRELRHRHLARRINQIRNERFPYSESIKINVIIRLTELGIRHNAMATGPKICDLGSHTCLSADQSII